MIVRGHSDLITKHVTPQSCRFVHIDGSHLYEQVRNDLWSAHATLQRDGVVAFDDYRTEHCIGVSAAIWESVTSGQLKVICASPNKFYATWGDPVPRQDRLIEQLGRRSDHRVDIQSVMDQRVVRVARIAPKRPRVTYNPASRPGRARRRAGAATSARSRARSRSAQTAAHALPLARAETLLAEHPVSIRTDSRSTTRGAARVPASGPGIAALVTGDVIRAPSVGPCPP